MKIKFIWMFRIIASVIMLQTLFYKFTGSPESIYIFTTIGVEPFGRIAAGISELIASILLLFSSTYLYGAILTLAIMSGALISHLTILGIEVQKDGGLLFLLAIVVFITSLGIILLEKEKFIFLMQTIRSKFKK
ncbi:MAG TPA: DoxX family protein [Leptospiraceae bacterium]|nr:DoxX family protein [Leptospiraceae bacterium]HMW07078.1 DoxX family protein [Leptospiraceae bacterium]HMX34485.1 DoxX family protein [Leptospiraceae bacterium]HMY33751.1 DoxX family protein [Leptospiraceae bacterium]HMZ66883.1 DoxX family protein [Leptospiraceae bacterium]